MHALKDKVLHTEMRQDPSFLAHDCTAVVSAQPENNPPNFQLSMRQRSGITVFGLCMRLWDETKVSVRPHLCYET